MFEARYIQKGEVVDYIPQEATKAGAVVFIGDVCGVAKVDIDANSLGGLAVTGVYDVAQDSGQTNAGDKLYWDNVHKKAVKSSSGNKYLGICTATTASDATVVRVLINVGCGDSPAA